MLWCERGGIAPTPTLVPLAPPLNMSPSVQSAMLVQYQSVCRQLLCQLIL